MARNKRASSSFDNSSSPSKKSRSNRFSVPEIVIPVRPQTKKNFTLKDLKKVDPLTENQAIAFQAWDDEQHLVLSRYAGCGKTYIAMFLALETVLDPETPQDKIIIIRSTVQGRDQGFLPGTTEEKEAPFEEAYKSICDDLFTWKNSYNNLKELGIIEFKSTSFLRGNTYNNAVVIFDEYQNESEQVCDTVVTRVGRDSRIILCGDGNQEDIRNSGFSNILKILKKMKSITHVEFDLVDILRSGLCREYLMAKYSK